MMTFSDCRPLSPTVAQATVEPERGDCRPPSRTVLRSSTSARDSRLGSGWTASVKGNDRRAQRPSRAYATFEAHIAAAETRSDLADACFAAAAAYANSRRSRSLP